MDYGQRLSLVARSGKDGKAAETHVGCQQRVRAKGFDQVRRPELARTRASPAAAVPRELGSDL